jgi:hypothetical protein
MCLSWQAGNTDHLPDPLYPRPKNLRHKFTFLGRSPFRYAISSIADALFNSIVYLRHNPGDFSFRSMVYITLTKKSCSTPCPSPASAAPCSPYTFRWPPPSHVAADITFLPHNFSVRTIGMYQALKVASLPLAFICSSQCCCANPELYSSLYSSCTNKGTQLECVPLFHPKQPGMERMFDKHVTEAGREKWGLGEIQRKGVWVWVGFPSPCQRRLHPTHRN